MYYGRYSREARRLVTSWPLPSEIIAHAKIEPDLRIVETAETSDVSSEALQGDERDAVRAKHPR